MADAAPRKGRMPGFRLFRIAGIQIQIDFSWFIIFFLLLWSLSAGYFPHAFPRESEWVYWGAGLAATILFFVSVLIHELAHSLVAQHHGLSIPSITLFVFGGVSQLSEEAKDPASELKIAIAGPLSSIALAGIFYGLKLLASGSPHRIIGAVLGYLALINGALAVFNLIPGFPLDGGRVLRAYYWKKKGSFSKATRLASDIGKAVAVLLIIFGGLEVLAGGLISGLWLVFIGIFLRSVAQSGYQDVILRGLLNSTRVSDIMVLDVIKVPPGLSLDRLARDYFLHYGYKGFPVFDDETPIGLVSLADIRGIPEGVLPARTVREVMTPLNDQIVISPDIPLSQALPRMRQDGRLLVMAGGRFLGLITKTGLMRFLEVKRVLGENGQ
ncbi:MAG: site-2 protease family protein [Nitrospiraceae bacterium]|nr:site-2 protease family protein [Nitrospiraceae bacterium]